MKGLRLKRKLRNYLRWQIYIINLFIMTLFWGDAKYLATD